MCHLEGNAKPARTGWMYSTQFYVRGFKKRKMSFLEKKAFSNWLVSRKTKIGNREKIYLTSHVQT